MELISKDSEKIVYEINSAAEIDETLIETACWPEDIPVLDIRPAHIRTTEYSRLFKALSDKYIVKVVYIARREELPGGGAAAETAGVSFHEITGAEEKELFAATNIKYFDIPWAGYMTRFEQDGTVHFINACLGKTRTLCVRKNDSDIALLTMFRMDEKNDLVAWVWIQEGIRPAEHKAIHSIFTNWMRNSDAEYVKCAVHVFNTVSNRGVLRQGFRPEYIKITRRD